MIKYDALCHTADALRSQVEEFYAADPNAVLIGSLGRAVLYDAVFGNPNYEFDRRQVPLLHSGIKARDIDMIPTTTEVRPVSLPFFLDSRSLPEHRVAITRDGADWILLASRYNFCEPLHPAVMQPVPGQSICGMPANTIPWQTQLAYTYAYSGSRPLRRKDELPAALLHRVGSRHLPSLPPELYEPFYRLAAIRMGLAETMVRQAYQRMLPEKIEARIDWLLTR